MLAAPITEFPTEVIAISLTVLQYVLRIIEKRMGARAGHVTPVQLLRTEMKWGRMLNESSKELRHEFDGKLENLRRELGG